MDVNEEIVKQWLHRCKLQFTIENVTFKTFGKKGGSNYSNIDILACDTNGQFYDYEIKWRSVYSLSATENEEPEAFVNQMCRSERIEKIKEIIGNKPYEKVFITTEKMFGKSSKKRKKLESLFEQNGISIYYFENIINELVSSISEKGKYDNETLQIIRMFKIFNLLKQ